MLKYCIDCNKKLNKWAKLETLRCQSCAQKLIKTELFKREPTRKLLMSKIAKEAMLNPVLLKQAKVNLNNGIPWNKGLKNVQIPYWLGKSNKNIIVKHHIDGNHQNNNSLNILKIIHSEHRSLHWIGYEYLVQINLIKDYLKEFMLKYKAIDINSKTGKVVHHIDCDRNNNNLHNLLYLKDRKIHNKLHQEAYKYLVRMGRINDYISWFFSKKEKDNQKLKTKEELIIVTSCK